LHVVDLKLAFHEELERFDQVQVFYQGLAVGSGSVAARHRGSFFLRRITCFVLLGIFAALCSRPLILLSFLSRGYLQAIARCLDATNPADAADKTLFVLGQLGNNLVLYVIEVQGLVTQRILSDL